jgi:hypothetical protein
MTLRNVCGSMQVVVAPLALHGRQWKVQNVPQQENA